MAELTTQARYVIQSTFDLLRSEDQKTMDAAIRNTPKYKDGATQKPRPKLDGFSYTRLNQIKSLRENFIESMSYLFDVSESELKEMAIKRN